MSAIISARDWPPLSWFRLWPRATGSGVISLARASTSTGGVSFPLHWAWRARNSSTEASSKMCIRDRYCRNGSTYISKAVPDAEELLKKLWSLYHEPMPFAVMQMKIYSLALFSLLMEQTEIPLSQVCAYFTETQVSIAKQVEQIITADLRQHHPAWELAARFSISETSMKNYFRGVFGQNISAYLRELRMRKASELLTGSRLSVSEVTEQVGYINQSKFAAAFKKQFGISPLEYLSLIHI